MNFLNKTAVSLLSLALIAPAFQISAVENQGWFEWANNNTSNAWNKTVELTGKAGSAIATTPSKAWKKTTDVYNWIKEDKTRQYTTAGIVLTALAAGSYGYYKYSNKKAGIIKTEPVVKLKDSNLDHDFTPINR